MCRKRSIIQSKNLWRDTFQNPICFAVNVLKNAMEGLELKVLLPLSTQVKVKLSSIYSMLQHYSIHKNDFQCSMLLHSIEDQNLLLSNYTQSLKRAKHFCKTECYEKLNKAGLTNGVTAILICCFQKSQNCWKNVCKRNERYLNVKLRLKICSYAQFSLNYFSFLKTRCE